MEEISIYFVFVLYLRDRRKLFHLLWTYILKGIFRCRIMILRNCFVLMWAGNMTWL